MKKTAIIGGIGPESTLDYYRGIIDAFKPTYADTGFPELIIESLDLKTVITAAGEGRWDYIVQTFAAKFSSMKNAGADFGVIASNTPHRVFRDIQAGTALPLISIVSETAAYIRGRGITRVCLLGTGFTMRSDFFVRELEESGIAAVVPPPDDIDYIQEKLMSEIELGAIRENTKKRFLEIVARTGKEHCVEGLVLGCTELPLIIKPEDTGLHYIDTMRIHIEAIVKEIRSDRR